MCTNLQHACHAGLQAAPEILALLRLYGVVAGDIQVLESLQITQV